MELYKTILVIWTEYPTDEVGLEDLGHAATSGDAYCVSQDCTLIPDVANDPHWDGTEFFGEEEEDDGCFAVGVHDRVEVVAAEVDLCDRFAIMFHAKRLRGEGCGAHVRLE